MISPAVTNQLVRNPLGLFWRLFKTKLSVRKTPMPKIDPAKIWSLNYCLLMSVISAVGPAIAELGLEPKELFLLAELDEHPYPAALAATLCMAKPTVTVYVKRLEAAGFVRREIDAT